ncbi:methionine adenosyltransferase 2 subunit beta-like isoform X2 [Littorina saxatilis]|uniref:Methionine adenosyltransferase 2 subunit beta n=2 Tax=Littorina saxatilis TaxID=31220 RepID=A0AAN9B2Q2_9CAEN
MAKRVLITGASGLLGRAVLKEFERDGSWSVLGLAFSRAGDKLRKVDITDKQAVNNVMQEFKPTVVIHSAAERRPDVVEKQVEATQALNVSATHFVCQGAAQVGGSVIYISTDYVFDGKNPPYKETDIPNPLNTYGKSKLEGEKVALAEGKDNAVLRVPILYGHVEKLDESAVTVLFPKVKNTSETCVMSDYERRYPTHCDDVASVLRQLAEKKVEGTDISGVFHWSGDENMTKYDMAIAMAEAFNLPTSHIQADKNPSTGTTRPYDAHLATSRAEGLGICKQSKFREQIKPALEKFFP